MQSWWTARSPMEKCLIPLFTLLMLNSCVMLSIVLKNQTNTTDNLDPYFHNITQSPQRENYVRDALLAAISPGPKTAARLQKNMRRITSKVHMAGTKENNDVLDFIANTYRNIGLDMVKRPAYSVLLSYPNISAYNQISIEGMSLGAAKSTYLGPAEAIKQEKASLSASYWWNAYSLPGTRNGQLVYANYGTEEDFAVLKNKGISVDGKIVIMRYSHGWRGAKVYQASIHKAVGVILYTDPANYVFGPTYPNGPSMPSGGTQRGTMNQADGDPFTPLYPSKNYTFRPETEASLRQNHILPSIPVLPVSYGYATKILASMDGPVASKYFTGALNVTYRLTGSKTYQIQVSQTTERRDISNVIGYLVGQEEPDRWIILSNHVDAWTYGSQDPNSGTVALLEAARGIMSVVNSTGWRPRRSILFCSWDAEEFGLIGSSEWVEEYFKTLQARAVAIFNVDNLKGALSIDMNATPTLYRVVIEAASVVPNPIPSEVRAGRKTVLDTWRHYHNDSKEHSMPNVTMPFIGLPSGGSDHKRFLMYIGVPVVYITYRGDKWNYPLYHTMFETAWTYENLVDSNYSMTIAVASFWAQAARIVADALVIPFNVNDYAFKIQQYVNNMNSSLSATHGLSTAISSTNNNLPNIIENIQDAVKRFTKQCQTIQSLINSANSGISTSLRSIEMINSRLTNLERVFINPRGIPGRPGTRHIIFADSVANIYAGETFCGVFDSVIHWQKATADESPQSVITGYIKDILYSLNDIQYSMESAILLLDMNGWTV